MRALRLRRIMLHVAIVGDRGSGRMTFLALLYAALVVAGSGQEDALRFHAAYESIEEITVLFQGLMSGGFPDSATKEGIHAFSFDVGVRKRRHGLLPRLGSQDWTADASTTLHFTLPGSLDDEDSGFLQGTASGTGRWRDVLDADAVIVLADSTKLAPKGEDSAEGPMASYDGQVESLFTSIQRWRSHGGRNVLHPIFVLSKFDAVSPDLLRAANLEATPPGVAKAGPRAAYAKALLEPNLPRTLATVRPSEGGKLRFGKPRYFFSWVRTDVKGPGQPERIRLRRVNGAGWEPDYSRDEYLALMDSLSEIAEKTKD